MKYLLFGTGEYYNRYKHWFVPKDIVALLDNSPDKQGKVIDGIRVLSPEEGSRLKFDAVVVMSFYFKEMKAQLIELEIEQDKIFHFFDIRKLLKSNVTYKQIQYYGNADEVIQNKTVKSKKVLLLSNDLTLGGPALALLQAAQILKKYDYTVIFAAMYDGPLRRIILENDIPVIIDVNLQIETMNEAEWTCCFELIICNTFVFYAFLSERNTDIPIIWWLHDSEFFYAGVDQFVLNNIDQNNLHIVSVGEVPKKAILSLSPSLEIGELLYGVQDIYVKTYRNIDEKVRFITIGYIENRKGQDILLAAVKRLPDEVLKACEFWLVGNDTSLLAKQIKEESKYISQINIIGEVNREEINRLLNEADVLICPSREDPMPTVVAEAMMHELACVVSDAAGTAEYISDGNDGLVFEKNNDRDLTNKILWCIHNKDKLIHIGENARRLYKKYFSSEAFEQNFLRILNGI